MKRIDELEKDYVLGLDTEEIDILQDLETGKYSSVENQKEESERLKKIFKANLR